jgi:hypothetical protein
MLLFFPLVSPSVPLREPSCFKDLCILCFRLNNTILSLKNTHKSIYMCLKRPHEYEGHGSTQELPSGRIAIVSASKSSSTPSAPASDTHIYIYRIRASWRTTKCRIMPTLSQLKSMPFRGRAMGPRSYGAESFRPEQIIKANKYRYRLNGFAISRAFLLLQFHVELRKHVFHRSRFEH